MRNLKKSIHRLLVLAEHLKDKDLNREYPLIQINYPEGRATMIIGVNGKCHNLFPFVLEELPCLFSEWHLNQETGYISYLPAIGMMNDYAILEFFGLEIPELLHCFSMGFQNISLYGGSLLSNKSTPKDVANNIFNFLETLIDNCSRTATIVTRRVLIEKVIISAGDLKTKKRKR